MMDDQEKLHKLMKILEVSVERDQQEKEKIEALDRAINQSLEPEQDPEKAILKETIGGVAWEQKRAILQQRSRELKEEIFFIQTDSKEDNFLGDIKKNIS